MQPPTKITALKYVASGKTKDAYLPPYSKSNSSNATNNSTLTELGEGDGRTKTRLSGQQYTALGKEMSQLHPVADVTSEDFENDGIGMWESHKIAEQHGRGR